MLLPCVRLILAFLLTFHINFSEKSMHIFLSCVKNLLQNPLTMHNLYCQRILPMALCRSAADCHPGTEFFTQRASEWRNKMKILDYVLLTLVIVGAINWGLIGFLQFDLVRVLFGDMSLLSRIIYALVGIGGLYAISYYGRIGWNNR